MPKLYYCNTIYVCNCGSNLKPESDINPLILQANPKAKFLVLCARDAQVERIAELFKKSEFKNINLLHYGWWDAKNMGLIDDNNNLSINELISNDIIIILDRKRIDPRFIPLCNTIESFCKNPPPKDLNPLCA